jgi:hypothetical protein
VGLVLHKTTAAALAVAVDLTLSPGQVAQESPQPAVLVVRERLHQFLALR